MINAVDLFAGAGGMTAGGTKAGLDVIFAANHNPIAVDTHKQNHPLTVHACQDLHQINWNTVPAHDFLLASPACQGHSRASGKHKHTLKGDMSRSTAWAVVSALEAHKAPIALIENVSDFMKWNLYPAWIYAIESLGYSIKAEILNSANFGVPQSRERLFFILSRSKNPIQPNFELEFEDIQTARTIIDLEDEGHEWSLVSDRVAKTQMRVSNSKKRFGEIHLDAAYGSAKIGRSLDAPLGVVTCVNKHSLVKGDRIRPLTIKELIAAQSFDDSYIWPKSKVATKLLLGNAVPPKMAKKVIQAVLKAA